jgi:hypothetical protein
MSMTAIAPAVGFVIVSVTVGEGLMMISCPPKSIAEGLTVSTEDAMVQ